MEALNGSEFCTIMDLPEEVRGTIYNKLKQSEANNVRLVCSKFKEEIDTYFNFNIHLNDLIEDAYFRRNFQLKARKCVVKNLEISLNPYVPRVNLSAKKLNFFQNIRRKILLRFKQNAYLEEVPISLNFKFPQLLKIFEMSANCEICPEHLDFLLNSCANFIEILILRPTYEFLGSSCLEKAHYTFQNLKTLVISVDLNEKLSYKNSKYFRPDILEKSFFVQLTEKSEFRNLKHLKVELALRTILVNSLFTNLIFSFLSKIGRKLESLIFKYIYRDISYRNPPGSLADMVPLDFNSKDYEQFDKVDGLKSFRLTNEIAAWFHDQTWLYLARNQRKLEEFEIRHKRIHSGIPFLKISFISDIISKNYETLVILSVKDISLINDQPLDISIFQRCLNLQKLTLDNDEIATISDEFLGSEIINLMCLPPKITSLEIAGFRILTLDLINWVVNDLELKSPMLNTLFLSNNGSEGDFGADSKLLEKVLSSKNLLHVQIGGFNYKSLEEKAEFDQVLSKFGCPKAEELYYGYLDVIRESPNGAWRTLRKHILEIFS